jgi:hypothetical protein
MEPIVVHDSHVVLPAKHLEQIVDGLDLFLAYALAAVGFTQRSQGVNQVVEVKLDQFT